MNSRRKLCRVFEEIFRGMSGKRYGRALKFLRKYPANLSEQIVQKSLVIVLKESLTKFKKKFSKYSYKNS